MNAPTAFKIGQQVVAAANPQGLTTGQVYVVTTVQVQRTTYGVFTTYTLDGRHRVSNGHLVLRPA